MSAAGGSRPIGILLAAGRSRRMGAAKLLLPWPPRTDEREDRSVGGATVVSAAFDTIAWACDAMVVVTGLDPAALSDALGRRAFIATPGAPDGDMLDSARRGLAAGAAIRAKGPFLLHLADHPVVDPGTIEALVATFDQRHADGAPAVVLPEVGGRGGHPVLIPAEALERISAWPGPDGLAGLWRAAPETIVRLPVDDPDVLRDLDTPLDYRAGASGRGGA